MMETINDRIKALVPALGFKSLDSFDRSLGKVRSTTKNITGPRQTRPGYDYLDNILSTYPNVDSNWLMRGHGNMFFPDKPKEEYVETLEQKIEALERANRRYETMIDMAAQNRLGNFQPLSKKAPVIKFYPYLHRELAKVG